MNPAVEQARAELPCEYAFLVALGAATPEDIELMRVCESEDGAR